MTTAVRLATAAEIPTSRIVEPIVASVGSGVPVRTIQRWVLRGWLTDYGDGQYIRVDLEEVVTLAEKRPGGRLHRPPIVA